MTAPLTFVSSMATRWLLAELAADFETASGLKLSGLSLGGIEAARRIRAGDSFDVVVLARDAMLALAQEELVEASSLADFAASPSALAMRKGALHPAEITEASLGALLEHEAIIAVSSGPSGTSARRMFARFGINENDVSIVEAPPGVPVAKLVAEGKATIGIQQLSELNGQPGIDIVGVIPAALIPLSVFTCGIGQGCTRTEAGQAFIAFLTSDAAAPAKVRHGMAAPDQC